MRTTNLEELADRPNARPLRRGGTRPGVGAAGLLAVVAILALPGGLAGAAAAPATPASTGVWAWGAFSNTTYVSEAVGAYANSLNLTNGNLSATVADVAAVEELHAELGAFALLNASAPSSGTRAVSTSAVSVVNDSGLVAVTGDLPAAGTYGPTTPVPLVNTTCYYAVRLVEISADSVRANYTYTNGSLALVNEQVNVWTGVNTTIVAYDWPSYSANANGTTTLRYTTSALVTLGWVAESLVASFSPALTLVQAPLSVGKTWNASSNVTVTGSEAYAVVSAARSGATNTSSIAASATSLNASGTLQLSFTVVGAQSVIPPNGTEETGYTIAVTSGGTLAGAYTLWDGLALLPSGTSGGAAPKRPATLMDPAIAAAAPGTMTEPIVSAAGFPVATTTASGSSALVTAPITPSESQSQIATAGTPAKPVTARVPSTSSPPTAAPSGPSVPTTSPTPPATTAPPTTSVPVTAHPTAASKPNPLTPVYLVGIVAGIALAFLAVGLYRRRHPGSP